MVKNRTQIKNILNKFINNLKLKGIKVNRLILFGSYANGKPKLYSDIDVAVVSSTFEKKNIIERQETLGEAIFPIQEPIEAIGYSYKEFLNPPSLSFLSEIISKGKEVYRG